MQMHRYMNNLPHENGQAESYIALNIDQCGGPT
jgi:hypothetical protein